MTAAPTTALTVVVGDDNKATLHKLAKELVVALRVLARCH